MPPAQIPGDPSYRPPEKPTANALAAMQRTSAPMSNALAGVFPAPTPAANALAVTPPNQAGAPPAPYSALLRPGAITPATGVAPGVMVPGAVPSAAAMSAPSTSAPAPSPAAAAVSEIAASARQMPASALAREITQATHLFDALGALQARPTITQAAIKGAFDDALGTGRFKTAEVDSFAASLPPASDQKALRAALQYQMARAGGVLMGLHSAASSQGLDLSASASSPAPSDTTAPA